MLNPGSLVVPNGLVMPGREMVIVMTLTTTAAKYVLHTLRIEEFIGLILGWWGLLWKQC